MALALAVCCAFSLSEPALAIAQDSAPPADAKAPAASDFVADGFRSARYGMTEDEVKAAIKSDFGLKGDAIVLGANAAERTQLLTIIVPDLLPDGGAAQVSYVFGYTSKTLIQVGISWSATIDPKVDAAKLYANSDVLVAHFTSEGYVPTTIRTGLVLDNGILLFRGEDKEGHATILLLQGDYEGGGDTQRVLKPKSLALLYAANSESPDIFKIEPGKF
jgi:hypothetical protein